MSESSIENAEQSKNTSGDLSSNGTGAEQLSKVKMALYGLANLPTSIVGLPIALYIPAFYSQNLGLSLATIGLLIAHIVNSSSTT